jgi:hypothetical protein
MDTHLANCLHEKRDDKDAHAAWCMHIHACNTCRLHANTPSDVNGAVALDGLQVTQHSPSKTCVTCVG